MFNQDGRQLLNLARLYRMKQVLQETETIVLKNFTEETRLDRSHLSQEYIDFKYVLLRHVDNEIERIKEDLPTQIIEEKEDVI